MSSSIAESTFRRASAFVLPCENAPGTSGIVATQNPSSPFSIMIVSCTLTIYFIAWLPKSDCPRLNRDERDERDESARFVELRRRWQFLIRSACDGYDRKEQTDETMYFASVCAGQGLPSGVASFDSRRCGGTSGMITVVELLGVDGNNGSNCISVGQPRFLACPRSTAVGQPTKTIPF